MCAYIFFVLVFINPTYAEGVRTTGYWYKEGSSYRFKFEANFELKESIDGYFEWTLLDSPSSAEKIGATAKEFVRGSYNPVTRQLLLVGYKKDDPYKVISTDEYRLEVSEDGRSFFGVTKGNGDWTGRLDSRSKQINELEKNRKLAIVKERQKRESERREAAEKDRREASERVNACKNVYPGKTGVRSGASMLSIDVRYVVRYVNSERGVATIEATSSGQLNMNYGEMKEVSCNEL